MASLTLKGIPDRLLQRLRERAEAERRSLNQQAIQLLETALDEARTGFSDAYGDFLSKHGPTPLDEISFEKALGGLRVAEAGRASPFDDDALDDGA